MSEFDGWTREQLEEHLRSALRQNQDLSTENSRLTRSLQDAWDERRVLKEDNTRLKAMTDHLLVEVKKK